MRKFIAGIAFLAVGAGLLMTWLVQSPRSEFREWIEVHPVGTSAHELPIYEAALPTLAEIEHVTGVHPADSGARIMMGQSLVTDLEIQPWIPGLEPTIDHIAEEWDSETGPTGQQIVVPAKGASRLFGTIQEAEYMQWVSQNTGEAGFLDLEIVATFTEEHLPHRWPDEVAYAHPDLVRKLTLAGVAAEGSATELPGDYSWPSVYIEVDDPQHRDAVIAELKAQGYDAAKYGEEKPEPAVLWVGGGIMSALLGLGMVVAWNRSRA